MRPLPRTGTAISSKVQRGDNTSTAGRLFHEREIRVRRSWRRFLRFDSQLPDLFVNAIWNDPDQVISTGHLLKDGDRCTVVIVQAGIAESKRIGAYVLKRYNPRGKFHTTSHAVMRSRAAWCWLNARRLLQAGLPTSMPLALLEERRAGLLRGRSFLLTEFVPGRALSDVVASNNGDLNALDSIADQFVHIWQRLGQLKIGYGDMKASNFIVDPDGKLWLIDLDGVRVYRSPLWLRRERRNDMQSFMRNWSDRPDVAEWFRVRLGLH